MISEEQRREIRRLFYAEHWPIGTIAKNLAVHPDTVRRAIGTQSFHERQGRDSSLDPYRAFLKRTLDEYPKIRATRLHQMVTSRGYNGSIYPLRRFAAKVRPKAQRAFQDLHFLPGEMAQIDWATFDWIEVGNAKRRLMCFTMVLAYSRMLFAYMFYDQKMARVLEGHQRAFEFFGGVPRVALYDNMKTAVVENLGQAVRFNDDLNQLAAHYCFRPRACNPRSGWEKGRVERAIRYIRDNFFEARQYSDIADLNNQLRDWLLSVPPQRSWPDDSNKSVQGAFGEEKLLDLPGDPYPIYEEKAVVANKKAFVHFDANQYSLPPRGASKKLMVRATHKTVSLFEGVDLLCEHTRSWSRKEKITDPEHQEAIADVRRVRHGRRSRSTLANKLPDIGADLLKHWSELEENLTRSSKQTVELIEIYGVDAVTNAAREAIARSTPRADSIRFLLQESSKPPVAKIRPRIRQDLAHIEVTPHDLSTYDYIGENHDDHTS